MLYVTGSTGREGFEKTIEYWLETTNVSYKKIEKDGNDYYILQHFLGYKWSLYFSTLVGSILTEMGYHTRDLHLGNDSVSFYISGQEPRKEAAEDAS